MSDIVPILEAAHQKSGRPLLLDAKTEIERLRKDKALLIELVLEDGLTDGAKNLIAIALRDGPPPPTAETMAWCNAVVARLQGRVQQKEDGK